MSKNHKIKVIGATINATGVSVALFSILMTTLCWAGFTEVTLSQKIGLVSLASIGVALVILASVISAAYRAKIRRQGAITSQSITE